MCSKKNNTAKTNKATTKTSVKPAPKVKGKTKAAPEAVVATEGVVPATPAPIAPTPAVTAKTAGNAKGTKAATPAKPKALSCLDAAVEVLKAAGTPMRCQEMITAMRDKGLWTSTAPTPQATLYSAILREITTKGPEARFKKTERGQFTLNA
jgi:hypothetical protein